MSSPTHLDVHVDDVTIMKEGESFQYLAHHHGYCHLPEAFLAFDVAKQFTACSTTTDTRNLLLSLGCDLFIYFIQLYFANTFAKKTLNKLVHTYPNIFLDW